MYVLLCMYVCMYVCMYAGMYMSTPVLQHKYIEPCCSAFDAHLEQMQRLEDMHHAPLPQLLLLRKGLLEYHWGTKNQIPPTWSRFTAPPQLNTHNPPENDRSNSTARVVLRCDNRIAASSGACGHVSRPVHRDEANQGAEPSEEKLRIQLGGFTKLQENTAVSPGEKI